MKIFSCATLIFLMAACTSSDESKKEEEISGEYYGLMLAGEGIFVDIPNRHKLPIILGAINVCFGECSTKLEKLVEYYDEMNKQSCGFLISARGSIERHNENFYFITSSINYITGTKVGKIREFSDVSDEDAACDFRIS